MLHLEHLNLVVKSIPETLKFYQAAFPHWQVRGGENSNWFGKNRDWVHFGDDYQYLTFNDLGEGEPRDHKGHTLGLSHFAFVTTNLDAVIARLEKAGFTPDKFGQPEPHRRNVYYFDPSGFEIEFVEYLSDLAEERNQYVYQNPKTAVA